jgi:hypothetical protein
LRLARAIPPETHRGTVESSSAETFVGARLLVIGNTFEAAGRGIGFLGCVDRAEA